MQKVEEKVLILGNGSITALIVARSLGRKGVASHLGWHNPDSVAISSRYALKYVDLPPIDELTDKLDLFLEKLRTNPYDLIIPVTEPAMNAVLQYRAKIEKYSPIAAPSYEAFLVASNKHRFNEIARDLGIPIPREIIISEEREIERLLEHFPFSFPVVVKPIRSYAKKVEGGFRQLFVRRAYNLEQLRSLLYQMVNISPTQVQVFFDGVGMGVEVLAYEGEILFAFSHERVHEPLEGGASSYRKSIHIPPDMFEVAKNLTSELNWSGVAMLEFRVSKNSGDFMLMELNPRFWGSIPLALASGADFPYYTYRLFVCGDKIFPQDYKTDIYARNIESDFFWHIRNILSDRSDPYLNSLPICKVLAETTNLLRRREVWDTWAYDDIKPAFSEIQNTYNNLSRLFNSYFRRVLVKALLKGFEIFYPTEKPIHFWKALFYLSSYKHYLLYSFRKFYKPPSKIVFVCFGNICRSAFAENYLRKRLEKLSIKGIETTSTGFFPKSDRSSPRDAVDAAREFGIDLLHHSSRGLRDIRIKKNDIIIVFDHKNMTDVSRTEYLVKNMILPLGTFSKSRKIMEFSDPWQKGYNTFLQIYQRIADSIDLMLDELWI